MAQEKNKLNQPTIKNLFARMSETNYSKMKNVQQSKSIEPPVSFARFQSLIANLPEIVEQYSILNTSISREESTFENIAKAYYYDFYTKPEIRSMYHFELKPCPSLIRNQLLQLPGQDNNNEVHDKAMSVSSNTSSNSKELLFNEDDYIFPVTYETFKKHINHKSLVKYVIKDKYKPKNEEDFKSYYTDKFRYKKILKYCYKEFYTNPEWRKRYKCEFQDAPRELLTKLLSFATHEGSTHGYQNIDHHSESNENEGSVANMATPISRQEEKTIARLKNRIPSVYTNLVDQCLTELPMTQAEFYDKISNGRKILKKIVQLISKENQNIYNALLSDNNFCEHILCEYYLLFYIFPIVRGIFEIQMKSCPSAIQELLQHIPKITDVLKVIRLPVQYRTFKKYANYEEILNQIVAMFDCADKKKVQLMRSDKMICKRLSEEFYLSYYLGPIITRELIKCQFVNAPMGVRIKLTGNDESSADENQSSSNEEEKEDNQPNIGHSGYLNPKDYIYPVTYETFRKYIDYDEVMNSMVKRFSQGNQKNAEKLLQNEIWCQAHFSSYYYSFYCDPNIRSVYNFNFDKAPESIKKKLFSFANMKNKFKNRQEREQEQEEQYDDIITIPEESEEFNMMTVSPIQPKWSPISVVLEENVIQELNNDKQQPLEAMSKQEQPFVVLHASYEGDPECENEQYPIQSQDDNNVDAVSLTPDNINIEDIDLDNAATEPYVPMNTPPLNLENMNEEENTQSERNVYQTQSPSTASQEIESMAQKDVERLMPNSDQNADRNQKQQILLNDDETMGRNASEMTMLFNPENNQNCYVEVHADIVNKRLSLPVSFDTFKIFITNLDDVVNRLAEDFSQRNDAIILNGEMRHYTKLEIYRLFYLLPEIRSFYDFHILPTCPEGIRKTLLQIPIGFDQIDIILPVSIDIFREFINYNEILDQLICTYVCNINDEEQYTKAENDEILCSQLFHSFYYSFYLAPVIIRGTFLYNFHNAPADLKKKLNQFAIMIIDDDTDNDDSNQSIARLSSEVNCEIENVESQIANRIEVETSVELPCAEGTISNNNLEQNEQETIEQNVIQTNVEKEQLAPPTTQPNEQPTAFDPKKWIFPVSIEVFKNFINYEELMDRHLKALVKGSNPKELEKIRNNEELCGAQFRRIYYTFYIKPNLRNKIKYNFDAAPNELKEKLLSVAEPITVETKEDKNNKEIVSDIPQPNEIPVVQRPESLLPQSNELTKQISKTLVPESNDTSDQITREVQNTEPLLPNKPLKLCTVDKVVASDIPEQLQQPTKSNDLTHDNCTLRKFDESIAPTIITTMNSNELLTVNGTNEKSIISKSTRPNLKSKDVIFPVSLKIFEKFVNQEEILDTIVKRHAKHNKMDYETLRKDQKFCRTYFKKFYHTFYLKPGARKFYNIKFNNPPTDLLKKLWSVGREKESIYLSTSQQQQQQLVTEIVESEQKTSPTIENNEKMTRVNEISKQPAGLKDVVLFRPSNLDEYINQRIQDMNLRQLINENLMYTQQMHDNINLLPDDKRTQQQQQQLDTLEFAEKLFFQQVTRLHNTKYLISSSFELTQEIWIAVTSMTMDEFLEFTGIFGATNNLYLYSRPYLLRRFYRHIFEDHNWPVNFYIKMTKFPSLMHLKCVQLYDFNLENISPKLFYWHELLLYTNFDDCVRYDYYKRFSKQISNELNMNELRKQYYNRCWCHNQWISQIPRITDQEIIKKVNEIDWSDDSQNMQKKKSSQNVCHQKPKENVTQSDVEQNQRSTHLIESSQIATITAPPQTQTKSNQVIERPHNEQHQPSLSSLNVLRRSQNIFTDSSQSTITASNPLPESHQNIHNEENQRSVIAFRRSLNIFTDSSQSTTTTTQPTPTKSNNQIPETQLLLPNTPQKKLEQIISGSQIPETQLLISQSTPAISNATLQLQEANACGYDHTYGISSLTIPPVEGQGITENFVDVNNVTLTQSQGLSVTKDPLMCASPIAQEIPLNKDIKKEKLTPLHDIMFLLDSEGSNYTCQPLSPKVIEIVENELSFENDFRTMLADESDEPIPYTNNLPEATAEKSELNGAILTEEMMQTQKIVPDIGVDCDYIECIDSELITMTTNLQASTNLNQALCHSSQEVIVSTNVDDAPSTSLAPSSSAKTIMARQKAKERRPSLNPENNQKSKRQKIQPEPTGQLRHEYRALPLCPIQSATTALATESRPQIVQQQATTNTLTATPVVPNANNAEGDRGKQLTMSQALTVDNTLFNSTELQNVLAQHTGVQTSSQEQRLQQQQNNLSSFVTIRKKVINTNTIEDDANLIIQKPTNTLPLITTNIYTYRHLIQFHYVDSLTESDIIKYDLLSDGLGQPYQQAVINIDGKKKCKVYGALVPSLFSNCSDSLHRDFQFVLKDLKNFHYDFYEKNIGGIGQEYENDLRGRVLKHFIKSAPIFSNFLLEYKSERSESGRCLPFERTTLERHSRMNKNKRSGAEGEEDNPFLIAIKPHILERMAELNKQFKT